MKEITRINHVGLRVKDMDISKEFYGKLGFEFIAGPVGPEPVAIILYPSGININLILNASAESENNVLMNEPTKHSGFTHIALEISDYDSAISYVQELGIPITGVVEFEGVRFFFIRDPDRNVIEFHQLSGS